MNSLLGLYVEHIFTISLSHISYNYVFPLHHAVDMYSTVSL